MTHLIRALLLTFVLSAQARGEGQHPVITDIFASESLPQRQTALAIFPWEKREWRLYLSAADTDGDLAFIHYLIQPRALESGRWTTGDIPVGTQNRSEISGFVLVRPQELVDYDNRYIVKISVHDGSGNTSEVKVLRLPPPIPETPAESSPFLVTTSDMPHRPYVAIGEILVESQRGESFTEVEKRFELQAQKRGVDAVIKVQLEPQREAGSGPLMYKGIAVRFLGRKPPTSSRREDRLLGEILLQR